MIDFIRIARLRFELCDSYKKKRFKCFINFWHFQGYKFLNSFLILANFDDLRAKFEEKLFISCFFYEKFLRCTDIALQFLNFLTSLASVFLNWFLIKKTCSQYKMYPRYLKICYSHSLKLPQNRENPRQK